MASLACSHVCNPASSKLRARFLAHGLNLIVCAQSKHPRLPSKRLAFARIYAERPSSGLRRSFLSSHIRFSAPPLHVLFDRVIPPKPCLVFPAASDLSTLFLVTTASSSDQFDNCVHSFAYRRPQSLTINTRSFFGLPLASTTRRGCLLMSISDVTLQSDSTDYASDDYASGVNHLLHTKALLEDPLA